MSEPSLPSLDFLESPPTAVGSQPDAAPDPDLVLPQATADALLALDGVDGAWIESDAHGQRFVVLHYAKPGQPAHLPATVAGLQVRVVGGEPIRAGG